MPWRVPQGPLFDNNAAGRVSVFLVCPRRALIPPFDECPEFLSGSGRGDGRASSRPTRRRALGYGTRLRARGAIAFAGGSQPTSPVCQNSYTNIGTAPRPFHEDTASLVCRIPRSTSDGIRFSSVMGVSRESIRSGPNRRQRGTATPGDAPLLAGSSARMKPQNRFLAPTIERKRPVVSPATNPGAHVLWLFSVCWLEYALLWSAWHEASSSLCAFPCRAVARARIVHGDRQTGGRSRRLQSTCAVTKSPVDAYSGGTGPKIALEYNTLSST